MNLRAWDICRVGLRSLWLQGLWTVQRGQNLGCVFSLWPVLERLYPDAKDRAPVACAHAAFFSTHPYTAGVILGVVAGLEEDRAESRAGPESVLAVRTAMSGPLAAVGEAFFWSTWRPVCFLLAVAAGLLWTRWAVAPLVFLISYNAVHLGARALGLWYGYRWRTAVVPKLAAFRIQRTLLPLALIGMSGILGLLTMAVAAGWVSPLSLLWVLGFGALLYWRVPVWALFIGIAAWGYAAKFF